MSKPTKSATDKIDTERLGGGPGDESVNKPKQSKTKFGKFCSVCGLPQRATPSGPVCANGHGGAESIEKPKVTRSIGQRARQLAHGAIRKLIDQQADVMMRASLSSIAQSATRQAQGRAVLPVVGPRERRLSKLRRPVPMNNDRPSSAAEDVRIQVLRSLRDKLSADLPRRCGDGDDSYLVGVRAALHHACDEINQRIASILEVAARREFSFDYGGPSATQGSRP